MRMHRLDPKCENCTVKAFAIIGAIFLAASIYINGNFGTDSVEPVQPSVEQHIVIDNAAPIKPEEELVTTPIIGTGCQLNDQEHIAVAEKISKLHPNIDRQDICQTVQAAFKYETEQFSAYDILALVQISSGFDKGRVGAVRHNTDNPYGLTQIRTIGWRDMIGNQDITTIDAQINVAVDILTYNIIRTKDKEAAISAYSTGVTAYVKHNVYNSKYVKRFNKAKQLLM